MSYDKTLSARLFKEAAGKSGALHTAAAQIFFAQNVVMFSHLMWHFNKKKKHPKNPEHFKCGSIQIDDARHKKTF